MPVAGCTLAAYSWNNVICWRFVVLFIYKFAFCLNRCYYFRCCCHCTAICRSNCWCWCMRRAVWPSFHAGYTRPFIRAMCVYTIIFVLLSFYVPASSDGLTFHRIRYEYASMCAPTDFGMSVCIPPFVCKWNGITAKPKCRCKCACGLQAFVFRAWTTSLPSAERPSARDASAFCFSLNSLKIKRFRDCTRCLSHAFPKRHLLSLRTTCAEHAIKIYYYRRGFISTQSISLINCKYLFGVVCAAARQKIHFVICS